ncbi:hypothetical protein [Sphingobacterium sp. LRF_L2]|uniref:hypothetical protein n=1 Tax=Sphingobacterium sp. LRF_L2 TaxID=3369421 RepID=UPI003F632392
MSIGQQREDNMKTLKKMKLGFLLILIFALSSCAKDDYYVDGGLAQAEFDGSILEYLDSKPREFDTIAQIIRLSGLESYFQNEEFTFFAPRDEDIKSLIGSYTNGGLNADLYFLGLDTLKQLSDVDPEIWQKYLLRHMFTGKNVLADYPQVDYSVMNLYGGQNYFSLSGEVCNIGVIFHDAVSSDGTSVLKYMGYRQLSIAYIYDLSSPDDFISVPISSSDIQPHNGVVHVLDYTVGQFGFNQGEVGADIIESKR